MNFIRPEARENLMRWREALAGAAVALLGLWWALGSLGLLKWMGIALALMGAALLWSGIQRARFRGGHGGLGVVSVDERQITYLAPVGGGFASIDALVRVEIGPDMAGHPVWRFRSVGEVLSIPASAEGTDALFDALAALPGVDMQAAIRASTGTPDAVVVIWQKTQPRLLH
ncbi:hypothetical protein [Aliiroseovarius subalbicans]|uniref:hypothetical protein n=1 Tax=Aliiroseovarius subalbicans TaxID=2925840 RepID=UPI001F55BAE0|nr:hypothetical protein [Aliiroseovarius subalbicans]MCI2399593.1 hypothetical protein [Aliiroseovarius subalbicans]